MGTTSTSDSWTGDKCSIYWTVNALFPLLLVWTITWPSRLRVVTYAGSSARPSRFCSFGAIKMIVAPQSMRARTCWISPLPSDIKTTWIIWDVSGLNVPHQYWLDMWALGSPTPLLTSKRSDAVVCCPSLPSQSASPTALNPTPPRRTSPVGPNAKRGRWVFWLLIVERLLSFDLVSSVPVWSEFLVLLRWVTSSWVFRAEPRLVVRWSTL